jgi:excisionase family DNA binding protein
MSPPPPLAYYRIKEACDRLGVSRSTLCRRIASGELPAWKLGSLTLIPTWAIDRAPPDASATEAAAQAAARRSRRPGRARNRRGIKHANQGRRQSHD